MRGVIHQHQMGQPIQTARQIIKAVIRPDIAIDQQKRLVAQQRQGAKDAAAGFQRFVLCRIADLHAKARAVAQMVFDLLAEPGVVDHHLADPGRRQGAQVILDQGHAGHWHQRLGRMQGQRA